MGPKSQRESRWGGSSSLGTDCQSTFCAQEGDGGILDVVYSSLTFDGVLMVGILDKLAGDRIWVDDWGWLNLMMEFSLRVWLVTSPTALPSFPRGNADVRS